MSELPARVQSKISRLRDAEQQALTITSSTQRAISETQRAHDINPHGDKAQTLAREVARLQALQPDNQARQRALADLNAKMEHYLALLPAHVELADAKPVKAKLGERETHLKVVQRLRGEIMGLISERGRVERSSPTIKEMKAAAAQYAQSLAAHATPRLLIAHGKFGLQFGRGTIGDRDPTPLEVLAWIDPAMVLLRLQAMIDAREKPENQMTASDRQSRLSEIANELFELERIEQAHIEAALTEGTVIEQRPNVDIRALLGLVVLGDKAKVA